MHVSFFVWQLSEIYTQNNFKACGQSYRALLYFKLLMIHLFVFAVSAFTTSTQRGPSYIYIGPHRVGVVTYNHIIIITLGTQ